VKHYWLIAVALLLLVGLGAAGCSVEATPVAPQAAPTPTQPGSTETRGLERGLPAPTTPTSQAGPAGATPESATGGTVVTPPPVAQDVVRLAREDLAQKLGLAPEAIQLVSVEGVEWSDTSLGCPQPGMMYAQVITPGFRVMLEAGGQTYEYHTDTGNYVVLCQQEEGSQLPSPKGIKDNTPWKPVEPIEPDSIPPTPKK
jgi:hypothetical protein